MDIGMFKFRNEVRRPNSIMADHFVAITLPLGVLLSNDWKAIVRENNDLLFPSNYLNNVIHSFFVQLGFLESAYISAKQFHNSPFWIAFLGI